MTRILYSEFCNTHDIKGWVVAVQDLIKDRRVFEWRGDTVYFDETKWKLIQETIDRLKAKFAEEDLRLL